MIRRRNVRRFFGLDFQKLPNGNLKMILTPEGRRFIREERKNGTDDERIFHDMLQDAPAMNGACQNGYEFVRPEEVGAMTDATIISDECDRNDHGDLTKCGRVYSNINYYQLKSDVEKLLEDGFVIWLGVK